MPLKALVTAHIWENIQTNRDSSISIYYILYKHFRGWGVSEAMLIKMGSPDFGKPCLYNTYTLSDNSFCITTALVLWEEVSCQRILVMLVWSEVSYLGLPDKVLPSLLTTGNQTFTPTLGYTDISPHRLTH